MQNIDSMLELINTFPDQHEMFIYRTGGGGEAFATYVTDSSDEYYKYYSMHKENTNRTRIINSPWNGWLNGQKYNINYSSVEELFHGMPEVDSGVYADVIKSLHDGKSLLSIAHSTPDILINYMERSNFIYQTYENRSEVFYSEFLAYIKVRMNEKPIEHFKDEIYDSGRSSEEIYNFMKDHWELISNIFEKSPTGLFPEILTDILFWKADKKNTEKIYNEFYSQPERFFRDYVPQLIVDQLVHSLYYHVRHPSTLGQQKKKIYKNVVTMSQREMLDGEIVQDRLRRKIDIQSYERKIHDWHTNNIIAMNNVEKKYDINIREFFGISFDDWI